MATAFFAKNEGNLDRGLRVVLGLVLLGIAVTGRGAWGYIGVLPLLTGLMGTCPVYSLLGLSTRPMKQQ